MGIIKSFKQFNESVKDESEVLDNIKKNISKCGKGEYKVKIVDNRKGHESDEKKVVIMKNDGEVVKIEKEDNDTLKDNPSI